MSWVRLDDQFSEHPKLVRAGDLAGWLWVCGLAYCARQLTDGFIPAEAVPRLTGLPKPAALAERLVKAGLWEPVDGGFRVHDFADWQPSAEQVRAKRDATARRVANWKDRKRQVRASGNASGNGGGNVVTGGGGNAPETPAVTLPPSPSPSSLPTGEIERARAPARAPDGNAREPTLKVITGAEILTRQRREIAETIAMNTGLAIDADFEWDKFLTNCRKSRPTTYDLEASWRSWLLNVRTFNRSAAKPGLSGPSQPYVPYVVPEAEKLRRLEIIQSERARGGKPLDDIWDDDDAPKEAAQ